MRWDEERWIKVFTRDTIDWLDLSWQAQGLLTLLMRKLDKTGQLPLGRHGLQAVAGYLRAPWSEIEAPLAELLADGCFRVESDALVMPNFQDAQSSSARSPAQRQAESRKNKRHVTDVTHHRDSHDVSRSQSDSVTRVTVDRDSHDVTPRRERERDKREEPEARPPAHARDIQERPEPTPENPVVAATLAELRKHPSLRALTTERHAEAAATYAEQGLTPARIRAAIADLALKAGAADRASQGWTEGQLAEKFATFLRTAWTSRHKPLPDESGHGGDAPLPRVPIAPASAPRTGADAPVPMPDDVMALMATIGARKAPPNASNRGAA